MMRLQARRAHWAAVESAAQVVLTSYDVVLRDLGLVDDVDAPTVTELVDPPDDEPSDTPPPLTPVQETPMCKTPDDRLPRAIVAMLAVRGPMSAAELGDELGERCVGALRRLKSAEEVRVVHGLWGLAHQHPRDADRRVLELVDGERSGKDIALLLRWPFEAVNAAYKRLRTGGFIRQGSNRGFGTGRASCERTAAGDSRLSGPTASEQPDPAQPEATPAASPGPGPRTPKNGIAPKPSGHDPEPGDAARHPDGGAGRKVDCAGIDPGNAVVQAGGTVRLVGLVDEDLSERFACERQGADVSAQACHDCLADAHARYPLQPARFPLQAAKVAELPGFECRQGWRRRFVVAFDREPSAAQLGAFIKGREVAL